MVDLEDFLWGFSFISLAIYFLQSLRKAISMASLSLNSPTLSPSLSWVNQFFIGQGKGSLIAVDSRSSQEGNVSGEDESCVLRRKVLQYGNMHLQDEKFEQENMQLYYDEMYQKGLHDKHSENNSDTLIEKGILAAPFPVRKAEGGKGTNGNKLKKRPARLVVPEYSRSLEFGEKNMKMENKEFEVQGRDFVLASKKGRREVMEDGYGVMVDILGDAKQAFFAVIDGHGGRAAADFVAENLGNNIVKTLQDVGKGNDQLEQAIRGGYLVTDREFLSQGVGSGACAASVLLKDGELHAANVGDCRVVLSRKGVAEALTMDHRVNREDERLRIENSGGFLHCRNGIWRVHGSLSVSRAVGDQHLKKWIISEPEIKRVALTSDCQFLILASDGLWDKVKEQEAVDVVLQEKSVESCKKLVNMAFSRGNMDDITVMVINLQNFVTNGC